MRDYETILTWFGEIYGEEVTPKYRSELVELLDGCQPSEVKNERRRLSQKDAILITYGDAICSADQPPLQTLKVFLGENVNDAISAVHLLPFFPYSSDDGFSVIDFNQVDPELGTWEDVEALSNDYDLMFDAVINHISVESEWFQGFLAGESEYSQYFITVDDDTDLRDVFRPRALPLLTTFITKDGRKKVWTTFSEDQVDLNYHTPLVLIEIVRILLAFVEHGARFIRLDAIAFIWKEPGTSCIHLEKAHKIVQFFRSIFDCVAPSVKIITETNVPHEENISYFGDGHNEAQMVYNFSLPPLVLNAFHTQNIEILSRWAKSLRTPSQETHFFNFLASHDGIGITPARGLISDEAIQKICDRVEALGGYVSYKANADGSRSPYELNINYLDALGDPERINEPDRILADRFLASQSILLALKGVPGIYYHSLFGSRSWNAGVELTGRNRTINREKLDLNTLRNELRNPNSLRYQVFHGYIEMLRARAFHAQDAFAPQGEQVIFDVDHRLMGLLRQSPDQLVGVLCFTNVSQDDVRLDLSKFDLPIKEIGKWREIISRHSRHRQVDQGLQIRMEPYGVLWLLAERSD